MNEAWIERWKEGRTNFHLSAVNPQLVRLADRFLAGGPHRVLVPLCGKTLDLAWLVDRGHEVAGAELSEIAVRAIFDDAGQAPVVEGGEPALWRAPGLAVFLGDFFALEPGRLAAALGGPPTRVWDRAAMIALPPELRGRYVDHLRRLAAPGAVVLLDTLTYDAARMPGPPFSVSPDEVRERYAGASVELLETADLVIEDRWKALGHEWMRRHLFLITLP